MNPLKVELFANSNLNEFQSDVNGWLAEQATVIEVIDIKFAASPVPLATNIHYSVEYSALIQYRDVAKE